MKKLLNLLIVLFVMSEVSFAQMQNSPFINIGSIQNKIILVCKGEIQVDLGNGNGKTHSIWISDNYKNAFIIEGINNITSNSLALKYDILKLNPQEQPKCIGCMLLNGQAQMSKTEILKIKFDLSELQTLNPKLNYSILDENNKYQLLNPKPFVCSKK